MYLFLNLCLILRPSIQSTYIDIIGRAYYVPCLEVCSMSDV